MWGFESTGGKDCFTVNLSVWIAMLLYILLGPFTRLVDGNPSFELLSKPASLRGAAPATPFLYQMGQQGCMKLALSGQAESWM